MKDYRINFQLPAHPLGEAIKPEKPVKVCEFREFDSKPHEVIAWPEIPKKTGATFHERKAERAAPPQSKWTPKVGDRVRLLPSCTQACIDDEYIGMEYQILRHDSGTLPWSIGDTYHVWWVSEEHIEPISTSSDSDGWVAWEAGPGKKRPVPESARVEIRWPSGNERVYQAHCVHGWDRKDGPVAYRTLP